MNMIGGY